MNTLKPTIDPRLNNERSQLPLLPRKASDSTRARLFGSSPVAKRLAGPLPHHLH